MPGSVVDVKTRNVYEVILYLEDLTEQIYNPIITISCK